MKTLDFIISYDISDAKRLRKSAAFLEKNGMRIQQSIFYLMEFSKKDLTIVIDELLSIIDKNSDDLRVYRIDKHASIHLKSGLNLENPKIFKSEAIQ